MEGARISPPAPGDKKNTGIGRVIKHCHQLLSDQTDRQTGRRVMKQTYRQTERRMEYGIESESDRQADGRSNNRQPRFQCFSLLNLEGHVETLTLAGHLSIKQMTTTRLSIMCEIHCILDPRAARL